MNATAEYLFDLRRHRLIVSSLPTELIPESVDAAYCAQDALIARILARSGGRAIGYKVAATNPFARALLKVPAPFYGVLLSESTHRSPATRPAGDFTVRCIEAEFGFELGADVPAAGCPYTRESIVDFIAAAIPSIEIVDHRYADWAAVGAASLIADNAIHGAWIEGEPVADWRDLDLARQTVTLTVNGKPFSAGTGADVLGHPLNVVAWLADELARTGRQFLRGDKITTGIAAPVYLAEAGDHLLADFGRLGRVELTMK